ncbi:MAG: ABC transporter permease [Acidimicrobiia bacterium]|nr:ABC transporter permease [Acidimicrobiia bacterium]
MFSQLFDSALLDSAVRAMIPILLAALGGMICERAGVFQIALEGMMLAGAFAAVGGSYLGESWVLGVVFGIVAGVGISLLLAFGTVSRRGDAIVLGIAINLFAFGITGFLLPQIFGVRGVFQHARIDGLDRLAIPGLSEIPVIGPVLFTNTVTAYTAFLLVPGLWFFLFRTPIGLRLRGVGERPVAAETLGVSPTKYRYWAVIASGALSGLAGAQLALGNVVQFAENMSSGRGWVAVVAVMLGRAHPVGVLGASVLFAFAEALGFRLQGNGLPVQVTDALPFVVTLIALVVARKRFARLLDLTTAAG